MKNTDRFPTGSRRRGPDGRHARYHHHHDEIGRGRRRRSGGRVPRGQVRVAVLLLLDEEPMHGYQLMQAIADRSNGAWQPSPGAIYPLLGQLEDEGLITMTANSGRRLAALTDAGRDAVRAGRDSWPDPFAEYGDGTEGPDLRGLMMHVHDAARQVARAGTDAQRQAAAGILIETRRSLYLLLAGENDGSNG